MRHGLKMEAVRPKKTKAKVGGKVTIARLSLFYFEFVFGGLLCVEPV